MSNSQIQETVCDSGPLGTRIIRLLTGQRDVYRELIGLARQQSEYVATGQSEELMAILAARHRLIDRLAPLDRELHPYKGRWQETLDGFAAPDRAAAGELLIQVQKLLAEILERDEADKESLIRQKTDIGAQLNHAVRGTQLNKAYGIRPRQAAPGIQG